DLGGVRHDESDIQPTPVRASETYLKFAANPLRSTLETTPMKYRLLETAVLYAIAFCLAGCTDEMTDGPVDDGGSPESAGESVRDASRDADRAADARPAGEDAGSPADGRSPAEASEET